MMRGPEGPMSPGPRPRRRPARAPLVAALLTGVGLAMPVPRAALAQYPPTGTTCFVDKTVVRPGDVLVVTGDRWSPNTSIEVRQGESGHILAESRTNERGEFRVAVLISFDAAGPVDVVVLGRGAEDNPITCVASIRVLSAAPGGPEGAIAPLLRLPEVAGKSALPMLLLLLTAFIFLVAQDRIDRKDPKLAVARKGPDPSLEFT
jgi:hypothetical protein